MVDEFEAKIKQPVVEKEKSEPNKETEKLNRSRQIDQEISRLGIQPNSLEIQKLQSSQEKLLADKTVELEKLTGTTLNKESQELMHVRMVEDEVLHVTNKADQVQELAAEKSQLEQPRNPEIKSETEMTSEIAREILGKDHVFGIEQARERFGINIDVKDLLVIPFSREQLERAKASGDRLVLRVDKFADGSPMTLENFMKKFPDVVTGELSGDNSWAQGSSALSKEVPNTEWALVKSMDVGKGTEHLSMEAQAAFIAGDYVALAKAISDTQAFWDSPDMVQNGPPREMIESARSKLPSLEELKTLREALPKEVRLPSAIEIAYDFLLTGAEPIANNLETATASKVEAGFGEPVDRPIDLGFVNGQMKIHTRRNMQFGRPHGLGDKKPGISIGYIQQ